MSIKRRFFLKNLCAGSALMMSGVRSFAIPLENSSSPPVIYLKTRSSMNEAFARGVARVSRINNVASSIQSIELDSLQLLSSDFNEQLFSSLSSQRLIGTMDTASFTIFQSIARSRGARFLYSGQHSWGGDSTHHSRHQIISTTKYQGVGSALAFALRQGEQDFSISETSLGKQAKEPVRNSMILSDETEWATLLAEALTLISLEQWQAGNVGKFERSITRTSITASEHLSSFVIEL
jgi:hypothetical protein